MFALSIVLLTFAMLSYMADATPLIWSTCAIASTVAMVAYWRNRAPDEVPFN